MLLSAFLVILTSVLTRHSTVPVFHHHTQSLTVPVLPALISLDVSLVPIHLAFLVKPLFPWQMALANVLLLPSSIRLFVRLVLPSFLTVSLATTQVAISAAQPSFFPQGIVLVTLIATLMLIIHAFFALRSMDVSSVLMWKLVIFVIVV